MVGGYIGKVGLIDLTTGKIRAEQTDRSLYQDFIGGYGIGVRILYERQKKGADPLGPENILGFTTGPLTGTKVPSGARYMVVCKSPLTGGWGDANSGGYFGSALKAAGWDALFFTGQSSVAKYLLVIDDRLELKDASHLWGMDTIETEEALGKTYRNSKIRVACIGPASEKLSLISGIVNDKGRIAARSGVGAVMGSKRLKAVVVSGSGKVPVADEHGLDKLRRSFLSNLRQAHGFPKGLMKYGTCGMTGGLLASGATPVKNWLKAGEKSFPGQEKITEGDKLIQYQKRRYACANCPIGCGGVLTVPNGPHPVQEVHKPEYETLAALGTMCLNNNLYSIFKMTDMCNRSGLDTISAGTVLAFVMECFENGVLTKRDTDGIELTWGNAEAMILMLHKIIQREGIGDALADGVQEASRKIKGSDAFSMHVGGQEPGMHNALFLPGRGTGYVCDPTPGRHTAAPMARIDAGPGPVAPYPELEFHGLERYEYSSKGKPSAVTSCYWQVGTCAGVCLFPVIFFGDYPLLEFLNAVTGWDMDIQEVLETGARIQTLRQCFNLREGIEPSNIHMPPRMRGVPPQEEGPLAGITIDMESLAQEYRKAMEWDPNSGRPYRKTLERLGLGDLVSGLK